MNPKRTFPICLLLAGLTAGCAFNQADDASLGEPSAEANEVTEVERVAAAAARSDHRRDVEAAAQDPAVEAARQERGRLRERRNALGAALLDDPQFERRFIDSYLSETEIEPEILQEEFLEVKQAFDLIQEGDDESIARAERLLVSARGPKSSAAIDFVLGNVYRQTDRLDEAAEAYATAIDKHHKFRRAWDALGQIHYQKQEYAAAIRAFSKVIEFGGMSPLTFGLLGVAHINTDNPIAAESAFRMAAMLDPVTPKWKLGMADAFFKQARYAEAASLFGSLIERQPNDPDLWLYQGDAFAQLGRPLDAAQNYEVVDRLGASTVQSLNSLGDIYAREKMFDLAVTAYERAIRKDPNHDVQRAMLAAQYLSASRANEETKQLVAVIEEAGASTLSESDRKEILRIRSRIALDEGAGAEEAAILEEIVALDPLDGDALISLGSYYERNGELEQAIFRFERAAKIDGFEAQAMIAHAQLLVREGRFVEALPLLEEAQRITPRAGIQEFVDQVKRAAKRGS